MKKKKCITINCKDKGQLPNGLCPSCEDKMVKLIGKVVNCHGNPLTKEEFLNNPHERNWWTLKRLTRVATYLS